jgi:ABC-type transport system substrate-binding protein
MTLRTRSIGLLGALAILVSACSGGTATTAPGATGPAGSGGTAASGGTTATSDNLKQVMNAEPTYFSLAYTDLPTSFIVGQIFTGMYRVNNKLAVIPDMATALPETSADGLTWTIKLRDGIKWSNGDPFTSADVKFTFDLAISKNCTYIPSFCSDVDTNLASVDAPDPTTVVFVLKSKFAPFLVTDLTTPIMPQKAVMASFATFQAAAGKADAAAVAAEVKKVGDATVAADCDGTVYQPASCDFATYVTELETLLQSGGIALGQGLLNKDSYKKEDGTTPDPTGYGNALFSALQDLDKSLKASQTDQVAAAFRLLDFQNNPVGTGPYEFDSVQAGQAVTLKANPTYWAGPVSPAQMIFPIIKDAATGAQAFQNGDANWLTEVNSDALTTLQADPNTQLASYADFGYYFIAFNLREGHIYSDINLRKAFSMCIDHDATVATATDNQGIPVYANVPPASWAFDPNAPKYTLDVAGAKQLIESSGWALGSDGIYAKGGKKLSTTLYVRQGRPQRISFASLAKDQLKQCGIDIDVKPSDFSTVLLPLLSYPNKFETYLGGWSTALDPDDSSIFGCDQIVTKDKPDANNFPGWCNQTADQLLTQGRQELNQDTRKTIYSQFQAIVHNDVPYYFLWADKANAALSKSITGGTNTVVTDGTIDLQSPLYAWNSDTWTVATK